MEPAGPDIEQLKQSLHEGLMSLVRRGDLDVQDISPMLIAFGKLPPHEQTAERFAGMLESARIRRGRQPRWRGEPPKADGS